MKKSTILLIVVAIIIGSLFYFFSLNNRPVAKVSQPTNDSIMLKSQHANFGNRAIEIVANLPEVVSLTKEIDSISNHKRSISFIWQIDDSVKNTIIVSVSEDNGENFVSYFTYLIDGNTMKIIERQPSSLD